MPKLTRRQLLRAFAAGGATAAGVAVVGNVTERVEVTHRRLSLRRWSADGFRVAVVSDVHATSEARLARALRAVELAVAERPDVIVLPGDFITHRSDMPYLPRFLRACAGQGIPMFATLGNHDYNAPERVVDAFREGPIRLLRNETVDIGGVLLAGLDDAIARRHRPDELPNADRSESLLVALHEPDFVSDLPSHVGLMLSGHSHGGQVRLPLMGAIHTPYGARRYIEGVYQPAEVPLFVSRGIGTVGPDLRLYCPPEVAILTLSGPA